MLEHRHWRCGGYDETRVVETHFVLVTSTNDSHRQPSRSRRRTVRSTRVRTCSGPRGLPLSLLLLALVVSTSFCFSFVNGRGGVEYRAIAVSGGLQEGFPDHSKMDYSPAEHEEEGEVVKAVFVGRALVRGCKAFLDVMEPGWRQYTPEPDQPLINSVVMVTGCHEHANQYWLYLVDARQFLSILGHEPRFLAVTPDTGLVDLDSNETDDAVRHWATHEILQSEDGGGEKAAMDRSAVAVPMVVAVHYHESFVPSPPIRIHADGTRVTNFPESLALWAGVNDTDRTANLAAGSYGLSHCSSSLAATCMAEPPPLLKRRERQYWDGIRAAIRHAEANRPSNSEWKRHGPPYFCQKETRLGTAPNQLRINYPFSRDQLRAIFATGGYRFETAEGRVVAA